MDTDNRLYLSWIETKIRKRKKNVQDMEQSFTVIIVDIENLIQQ